MSKTETDQRRAVILDHMPHGQSTHETTAKAIGLGVEQFRLFEIFLTEESDIVIGEMVSLRPPDPSIAEFREMAYDDLTSGARSELDYAVEEIVASQADRFIEVYNEAQPITLRLHQLDLLPGIGEKLRNNIIDELKRSPFEDFTELEERVDGLHDAEDVLVERILEEIHNDDLKYYLFTKGSK